MAAPYAKAVFINCSLDNDHRRILEAFVFAIHDCGFTARCALEVVDAGEVRIDKIKRLIRESQFGIHDISRTKPDLTTGLPRFNMPLLYHTGLEMTDTLPGHRRSGSSNTWIALPVFGW